MFDYVYRQSRVCVMRPSEPREEFKAWLLAQSQQRGWSLREVGRKAGIAETMPSAILSGHLPQEWVVRAIARAFHTDEEHTLYLAGYTRSNPNDGLEPELIAIAKRLSEATPEQRDKAMRVILAVLEAEEL